MKSELIELGRESCPDDMSGNFDRTVREFPNAFIAADAQLLRRAGRFLILGADHGDLITAIEIDGDEEKGGAQPTREKMKRIDLALRGGVPLTGRIRFESRDGERAWLSKFEIVPPVATPIEAVPSSLDEV